MKRRIVALTLALSVFAVSNAFAQADLGIKKLGVSLGYVSPENLDGTFSFGGLIDHGTIAPRFGLESRLEYWGWSEKFSGTETSVHDIVLGARTKYHFETANPKFQPFVGGGLGIHFLTAEVTSTSPSFSATASENKLGIDIGGGFAMPMNPRADFLGEAWNSFVDGTNQFSLRAGMQWKFGN
jgi:hypothetical protein